MLSDDPIFDNLVMAYNINYSMLKEIQVDPMSYKDTVPEEVMLDMAELWAEMIERIPESHSMQILRLVYGE